MFLRFNWLMKFDSLMVLFHNIQLQNYSACTFMSKYGYSTGG